MQISDIWKNMVNFIHYFGYLELGYMEFPLIWDILAGTNAFPVSRIVCIRRSFMGPKTVTLARVSLQQVSLSGQACSI